VTIHHGLTFDEYSAIDAVNWSSLKEMSKSALHYQNRLMMPRTDTAAMLLGRAVHSAVLEPDRFPLELAVWDQGDRRGNAWLAFKDANSGRDILKADEYETCLAIRDAVHAHSVASGILRGESEVTITWTDAETGIACKARVDHMNEHGICDLKTTADLDPHAFESTCARLEYYGQLAFYNEGTGFASSPRIIAVESGAPHDVVVYHLSDDALNAGRQLVRDHLYHLAGCIKSGIWPGRSSAEQELTIPSYLLPEEATGLGITVGGASA
jgi:hypothetical protein